MRKKIGSIWKKYWFVLLILAMILIKQWLVGELSIYARDTAGVDQWKMLKKAEDIISGNYWENYSTETMFKRDVFFPFFLAVVHACNIPYLTAYTTLYSICSLLACYSLSHYCKNRVVLLGAFAVVLFSPISYYISVQFVYNIGLIAPLAIGMLSCMIIAYNKRNSLKSFLGWSLFAGLFTTAIWLDREDTQWILILLAVYIIVVLLSMDRKKKVRKEKILYCIYSVIPVAILVAANTALCAMNYVHYGLWVTNDHIATGFADAYNSILKIQPESYPESCSITRDMLERAMEVSPSFAELKEYLEGEYAPSAHFLYVGRAPEDGEIEDGWMPFVLRNSAAKAGYYKDAIETDRFWTAVSEEIEAAFDEGKLEERSIAFFGSMLKHPWVEGQNYFSKWMTSWGTLLKSNLFHELTTAELQYSTIDETIIKRYEAMTYNNAVEPQKKEFHVSGWAFPSDGAGFEMRLESEEGEILEVLEKVPSSDVAESYTGQYEETFLENCRFSATIEYTGNSKPIYLVLYDNEQILGKAALTSTGDLTGVEGITGYLDECETKTVWTDPAEAYTRSKIDRAKWLSRFYEAVSIIFVIVTAAAYIGLCAVCLSKILRKKELEKELASLWIYMSAIIGSILTYTGALAYIDAFMFEGLWYSAPVTGLVDMLNAVGIIGAFILCSKYIGGRKRNDGSVVSDNVE